MNEQNVHLMRASLLLQHQRWEQAEAELRLALAMDSDDAEAHRLLAYALNCQDKLDAAEAEAEQAVHLAPDNASGHVMRGLVLINRRRFDEALQSIEEALRIDPYDSDSFGYASMLWFQKRDWTKALEFADKGLQIDSEDRTCLNYRAMSLVKLGRQAEADRTLQGVLALDPNDARSHANQGWSCLEKGQRDQALYHFREALALDPMNEWARHGILEALKAKYFLYRILLGYFLFMAKLKTQVQWAIVIGGIVLQRTIGAVAQNNPALAPYLNILLVVYLVFGLFTWLGVPIFNLLLFTNRFGRLTLFPDQKRAALLVAGVLLTATGLYGACLYNGTQSNYGVLFELSALYVALLSIPASTIFLIPGPQSRWIMVAATSALGLIAVGPALLCVLDWLQLLKEMDKGLFQTISWCFQNYVWGILGSQFLAQYLINRIETR